MPNASWSRAVRLIIMAFIAASGSRAHERARPFDAKQIPASVSDEFVFVPGSEVAWADYAALRRDFPQLRDLSDESINAWIIKNHAFVSRGQLSLGELRNTPVPTAGDNKKIAFRPPGYGRASTQAGLDIKGSGLSVAAAKEQKIALSEQILNPGSVSTTQLIQSFKIKDHSDGLMSFGEAVAEVTRQLAVQRLFDLRNAKYPKQKPRETVESYFIISLPFEISKDQGQKLPAALYGRQLHWGRRRGRPGQKAILAIPYDIYTDDFGHFQGTTNGTAIDFGGVIVTDQRLAKNFGVRDGGQASNPQDSKPWAWGHEVAAAFKRGDRQAVFRHVSEMMAPVDDEWSRLPVAKRLSAFKQPARQSRLNMELRLRRKNQAVPPGTLNAVPPGTLRAPPPDRAEDIFRQALNDADPLAREVAALALQRPHPGSEADAVLLQVLKHGAPPTRTLAALALKFTASPHADVLYTEALHNEQANVRSLAAMALQRYNGPEIAKLFTIALTHDDLGVRGAALRSLRAHEGPQSDALYLGLLGSSHDLGNPFDQQVLSSILSRAAQSDDASVVAQVHQLMQEKNSPELRSIAECIAGDLRPGVHRAFSDR